MMIRVRMVTEPEYRDMREQVRVYSEVDFYDLLLKGGERAFQDPASQALIRGLHGTRAVEEKWCSKRTPEGKLCLPALSNEAKYGLVLLHNSAQGLYTLFDREFGEFEAMCRMEGAIGADQPKTLLVWDVLSRLEQDALIVFRKKDFDCCWDIPVGTPFLLENFRMPDAPADAAPVPAMVDNRWGELRMEDGILHTGNFFYDQMYRWQRNLPGLLKEVECLLCDITPLPRPDDCYTPEEFDRLDKAGDWEGLYPEVQQEIWRYGFEHLPEDMRIRDHMVYIPEDADNRRIPFLAIRRRADGRFELREDISVKWPCYGEMLDAALKMRAPDGETLVLAVDRDEIMRCAEDLRYTVCAFRMEGEELELFGWEEGLYRFGRMIQEMLASGQDMEQAAIDGEREDRL